MATRKQLADATEARLRTIDNVAGYRGMVPNDPPQIADDDPRVRPYWVLRTQPGRPDDERMTGDLVGVQWGFQLTIAAGVEDHLDHFADEVIGLMHGWRPFPETARCWMDRDFIPGPNQRDDDVTPPRFWTPLIFKIHT